MITKADKDSPECQAWRAEAAKWCAETCARQAHLADCKAKGITPDPPPSRSFNDRYFSRLAEGGGREFPGAINVGNGWESFTDLAAQAGEQMGGLSGLAQGLSAVWGLYTGLSGAVGVGRMGWDAARNIMRQRVPQILARNGVPGARVNFPDGLEPTHGIELKGPSDSEQPGQFEKERVTSPNEALLVVSGETCDTEGLLTPGGACKC